MWICPKCEAKVNDGFEVCWGCGSSPKDSESPAFDPQLDGIMNDADYQAAQKAQHQKPEDLVTVGAFWKPWEAYLLRCRLEAEGVHTYVADETLTGGLLANAVGGILVQVAQRDEERARQILADEAHHEVAGASEEEE
jgi:hypothetical protein